MSIAANIQKIREEICPQVKLIAVSKTKPNEMIQEAYNAGQRAFGENKVQEMVAKFEQLPKDIEWHMIGHLQSNKVKYIAPFVHLIHSIDSQKLLETIQKEAVKNNKTIDVLLQIYIASEETKFGLSEEEALNLIHQYKENQYSNIRVRGLMGMASLTDDRNTLNREFSGLKAFWDSLKSEEFINNPEFDTLSMGMSGDYGLAVDCGSTMIRVGSSIFGSRA
ncbi:MAG: YggS family pyridoxal phosphate-dependent enzyme [Bacteroidetes bacterium]|nr:YggS family pyridoxal phosphate-dependent enzyme [Bacteroidota bacterium]